MNIMSKQKTDNLTKLKECNNNLDFAQYGFFLIQNHNLTEAHLFKVLIAKRFQQDVYRTPFKPCCIYSMYMNGPYLIFLDI